MPLPIGNLMNGANHVYDAPPNRDVNLQLEDINHICNMVGRD